jgi:lipoprotein-anchoring transpeptidase ErfK/SrfK
MWFHRDVSDPADLSGPSPGRARLLIGLVAVVLAAGIATVALRDSPPEPVKAAPVATTTTSSTTTTTTEAPPPTAVPASTPLATPNGEVSTYDRPGGSAVGTVGFWYGYPMTMPIVEDRGEWLRIMMPERPNMSTAWVRADDVTRSSSSFRIVIRLAQTRLTAYQDGVELFSAPVGIGTAATPTAPGSFFVAVIEKPGPPGYGPLVLDTNGHSEAIQSWEGSGDAITAIHGPISASSDARIGSTGTRISNGCIRMHEADLVKLDVIPLGTPVDIIA